MHKAYEYKVLCPVCDFEYYNYEMLRRWDGLWVCKDDWEPRNILDFYKNRNDFHKLPFILPNNDGVNVGPTINISTLTTPYPGGSFSTALTSTAIAGIAVAGIAIAGKDI